MNGSKRNYVLLIHRLEQSNTNIICNRIGYKADSPAFSPGCFHGGKYEKNGRNLDRR